MTVYQMLGHAIAGSVQSVGSAFHLFPASNGSDVSASQQTGWSAQFSPVSLDQRHARRSVDALYRGATVRI